MRVLMVCLGNICRSPLAEGILRHKVNQHDLDWKIDSAGTGAWHAGEEPDMRSIEVALKNGIDIRSQKARQFNASDFQEFDLILAMDAENYRNILSVAESELEKSKVQMILNLVYPNQNRRVPDPYYGGPMGFENVYEMLEEACETIIEQFK